MPQNTYKWNISTQRLPRYEANGHVFRDVIIGMKGTLVVSDGQNSDDSVTHETSPQPPTSPEGFVAEQDLTYPDIVKMFEESSGASMIEMLKSTADRHLAERFPPPKPEEGRTFEAPED